MERCRSCSAPVNDDDRFCVQCGFRLHGVVVAPVDPPRNVTLERCPSCSAANSSTRRYCGRCREPLRDGAVHDELLHIEAEPAESTENERYVSHWTFRELMLGGVAVVVLTAVVGLWLILGRQHTPPMLVQERSELVAAVQVSSTAPSCDAAALIDGNSTTSWQPEEGHDDAPWVTITLNESRSVTGLTVWSGDQHDATSFGRSARPATIRIDVAGVGYRTPLRDIPGPQSVELPEAIRGDDVRVTIEAIVTAGVDRNEPAISEIQINTATDD